MKTVSKKKESAPVIITELGRTELLKQVEQIRNRVANGESQISMCSIFNVSPMTISRVVRKETWK